MKEVGERKEMLMKAQVAAPADLPPVLNLTSVPCGTPGESQEPHLVHANTYVTSPRKAHADMTPTHTSITCSVTSTSVEHIKKTHDKYAQ